MFNVSTYPCANSNFGREVAFISIPKNLYSKEYFYKVEDYNTYYVFNLMYKNFILKKFIYYYSSSLYCYSIDDKLNITFYEKKVLRKDNSFSNCCSYSYKYYYQYVKSNGVVYEKYLNSMVIKNNNFIDVGYINSYGDKLIQFYKVYYFNFK